MRFFITGITGLLGNNLARSILRRGDEVHALVRPGSDPAPLDGLPVKKVTGDLHSQEVLNDACRRADAVIHSAGFVKVGWKGIEQARHTNVQGVLNIARAARQAGIPMVHVSSVNALALGAADKPADEETPVGATTQCPYVVTKRAGDEAVQQEIADGLHASIVHPGFMLGPWDWKPSSGEMLLQVHQQFTPLAPRGGCSVCDVRDVAAAILQAVEEAAPGDRFILAGENMTYLDLWRRIARITGGSAPWARPGPVLPYLAGVYGDLLTLLTGKEGPVNSAAAEMSGQFHYYSSQKAFDRLGYQSRAVDESIADAWRWFQHYGFVNTPASTASQPHREHENAALKVDTSHH